MTLREQVRLLRKGEEALSPKRKKRARREIEKEKESETAIDLTPDRVSCLKVCSCLLRSSILASSFRPVKEEEEEEEEFCLWPGTPDGGG